MSAFVSNSRLINVRGKRIVAFFILVAACAVAPVAHAASLFLNPSQGSYATGSVVPVDIIVDTEGETINAVSGTLVFDGASMKPTSVKINDSIVTLWIQQPGITTRESKVSFEGLILSPGFSGRGKIATVYFQVTGAGSSKVEFSSGMTLKNDGLGTNILEHLAGSTFTITGDSGSTIAHGEVKPLPQGGSSDPSSIVLGALRPPVVTGYTMHPKSTDEFAVQGVTYPNAQVKLWLQDRDTEPEEFTFTSDGAGNFSYRKGTKSAVAPLLQANALSALTKGLQGTPHRFWLAATVDGVETPTTQPFEVVIGGFGIPELLLLIVILLILGVVGLLIFEMILLRRVYDHDHEEHLQYGRKERVVAPAHYPGK